MEAASRTAMRQVLFKGGVIIVMRVVWSAGTLVPSRTAMRQVLFEGGVTPIGVV